MILSYLATNRILLNTFYTRVPIFNRFVHKFVQWTLHRCMYPEETKMFHFALKFQNLAEAFFLKSILFEEKTLRSIFNFNVLLIML